jgi:hypothetical protein
MRLLILFAILVTQSMGHTALAQTNAKEINQYDAQGKAHGLWYTSTPAHKGEPAEVVMGNYDHGNKTGVWYISDDIGNMHSIETFKHNVRDGEVKYFENGQLICVGHFRGLNPRVAMDTFVIVDPMSGEEKLVSVPTDRGSVRHGRWRFYDQFSGRLIREEEYQIDELIYKMDFSISPNDSVHYERRNQMLPHNKNSLPAISKFKPKEPVKSLIGR